MTRLRFNEFLLSEGPGLLGLTQRDWPRNAAILNRAQERLLNDSAASDESWIGTWAEMAFLVDRRNPYITCPRGVARLESIDVCGHPVPLHNQFHEYMRFGSGRMPKLWSKEHRGFKWFPQGYTRNTSPTFADIQNPPQQIQVFAVNTNDYIANPQTGAIPRVFIQGLDLNGNIVTSQDNGLTVQGEFITLTSPYALSVNSYSTITGIQKDVTQGQIQYFQSDPIWGSNELLLTMEPTEVTAWYRRYYIGGLPNICCQAFPPVIANQQPPTCGCPYPPRDWVMVTALAKLDLIPVVGPTDYCIIQSLEALIQECQSVRYLKMDDEASQEKADKYHKKAVQILIGQLTHMEGKNNPSILFKPFGSANLNRVHIGMR